MFTKRNLLILIGRNVVISLLSAIIAGGIVYFLTTRIEQISNSISLNHQMQLRLEQRNQLAEQLRHDIGVIGTNDIKIENAFISSDNILEFITRLDGLAQKAAVTQMYSFETPQESTVSAPFPISTINFSNNLQANIVTFSDYLKEFETLPYFAKIDGFTISSQNPLGWYGLSTVSFRGVLYTKTTQ